MRSGAFASTRPSGPRSARSDPLSSSVSSDSIGRLPLWIVVPTTDRQSAFAALPWFVSLPANSANGLSKNSRADAFLVKSILLGDQIEQIARGGDGRLQNFRPILKRKRRDQGQGSPRVVQLDRDRVVVAAALVLFDQLVDPMFGLAKVVGHRTLGMKFLIGIKRWCPVKVPSKDSLVKRFSSRRSHRCWRTWPTKIERSPRKGGGFMATVRHQIGPAHRGLRLTLQEFQEAEWRPGYLYELARGVLVVTKVPRGKHAQVVHNTHELFSDYFRNHPGLVRRIGHGSDVRYVTSLFTSDRHPDLAVLFRQAPADVEGKPLSVLGVEVVSRGKRARRRDYVEKREEYLAVGLLEYWIVDPEERRVTVLIRREANGVATWAEQTFGGEERIGSGLLPGFAGTVAELWADLDDAD